MADPINKGVPYDVLKWEIAVLCPRLMEFLSRAGNASHAVVRTQTMLQHCNRVHKLVRAKQDSGIPIIWDHILANTCVGMGIEFKTSATSLVAFVRAWSGGKNAYILKDLENYEKGRDVKRKLLADDVGRLANVELPDAPTICASDDQDNVGVPNMRQLWS